MQKRMCFSLWLLCLVAPLLSFLSPIHIDEEIGIAREVHTLINDYRRAQGLNNLIVRAELNAIAHVHSEDMATGRVPFSHEGFDQRVNAVRKYAKVPYRVAENLYATYPHQTRIARDALRDWLKSHGHKENIHGRWRYTGISVVKNRKGEYYITQLFVGKQ